MGFMDALLGRGKKPKAPAPDRLFAITTAAVQLDAAHGIGSRGVAAIVFQPLATGDFRTIVTEMEELVRATGTETGTSVETTTDKHDYRWAILRDPDVEDLAVAANTIGEGLIGGGYGDRLLCAVFAFADGDQSIHFIYNYKRGTWYPFVPAGAEGARNSERELQLKAALAGELPFEPELERWFPLWGIPI